MRFGAHPSAPLYHQLPTWNWLKTWRLFLFLSTSGWIQTNRKHAKWLRPFLLCSVFVHRRQFKISVQQPAQQKERDKRLLCHCGSSCREKERRSDWFLFPFRGIAVACPNKWGLRYKCVRPRYNSSPQFGLILSPHKNVCFAQLLFTYLEFATILTTPGRRDWDCTLPFTSP